MDPTQTEHWEPVPGHEDYEASTLGRVRSRKAWRGRSGRLAGSMGLEDGARILRGSEYNGARYFTLDGHPILLGDILLATFGLAQASYTEADRNRPLSDYERSEVREAEGYKDAYAVALDMRIDPSRVREIWEGLE